MVAGLGVLVQYWLDSGLDPSPEIFHHYGFQALGAGVTFSIVFRTQLAWNRYWEALVMRWGELRGIFRYGWVGFWRS